MVLGEPHGMLEHSNTMLGNGTWGQVSFSFLIVMLTKVRHGETVRIDMLITSCAVYYSEQPWWVPGMRMKLPSLHDCPRSLFGFQ